MGLAACDKTPLENSIDPGNEAQAAQMANQATFGNLIAALNNIAVQIDRLELLRAADIEVRVVNVEDVLNGNNVEALNNALNRNNLEVTLLQDLIDNSLNNFAILNDALNNNQIAIAIDVLSGGDVILFVQQPAAQ